MDSHAPAWQPEHQSKWEYFLRTETGLVLRARMRAVAAAVSASACADAFHTSHSAGVAHGWHEAIAWLESLSRSSRAMDEAPPEPQTQAHDKQAPGRDELLEQYAP